MKVEFKENFIPEKVKSGEVVLVNLLKLNGLKVSTAESFTGGLIASRLTSVSGASSVFYEGLVTYNEDAKVTRLGVKRQTLDEFFPVSKEVALEMAKGLLADGNCDLAISTTGIAGPNSDSSGFPVGLCFIAINFRGNVSVYKYRLDGDRQNVVKNATDLAIDLAINTIKIYRG